MKQIFLMVISILLFPSCNKNNSSIEMMPPTNTSVSIRMVVEDTAFTVTLYDNSTTEAFLAMLPMVIDMKEMNSNEKYYDLPDPLPSAAIEPKTIQSGDLMLYGSKTLVLFYETFSTSYSYTKIGRISDVSGLKAALGTGNVTVKFELE